MPAVIAPLSRSGRWRSVVVLAATLLAVAATAALGVWQLHRAAAKTALQQALDANRSLPRLGAAALPVAPPPSAPVSSGVDLDGERIGRRIRLRGTWVDDRAVYLENRQMDGRVGFFLVMPLRLEGRRDAILVQRGWLPRDLLDRTRLQPVRTPTGTVEVDGRIAPAPARLFEFAPSTPTAIRQNLVPAAFAVETGLPLQTVSVLQDDPPDGESDGLVRHWPAPAVDVHKHHGYAAQWFALSVLIATLHVWFQFLGPWFARRRRLA